MGREQKRKQAKLEGRNVKEVQKKKQESNELKPQNLVRVLCVVIAFFVIIYLITGLFITKDFSWFDKKEKESNNEEKEEVTNKILAAESLKQKEEDYYVYYYDSTDEKEEIKNITYMINEKVYKVDLHDDFNSNYIGEPSGIVDNINDLKVQNPTIIKVSSEKITDIYNGSEEIKAAFNK